VRMLGETGGNPYPDLRRRTIVEINS
jgi:hypothetical protein